MSVTTDRISTALQETGQAFAVCTLADVLEAAGNIALEPSDVLVSGDLIVAASGWASK